MLTIRRLVPVRTNRWKAVAAIGIVGEKIAGPEKAVIPVGNQGSEGMDVGKSE
jgi:hypothetical protein